jgi:predicted nuclease with TOPRIM domain
MTNKEKFPELWATKERLEKRKAEILAQSNPLREKRDALIQKMAPMEAEAKKLADQIHAIERPALGVIDNEIAACARGMHGYSVKHSA